MQSKKLISLLLVVIMAFSMIACNQSADAGEISSETDASTIADASGNNSDSSLSSENNVFADTFEEAFQICVKHAEDGEAVLLSPACASWGMFPNYEVRGQQFKDMVNALKA